MRARTLEERFWSRVDRRGDDECWLWDGAKTHGRYGTIAVRRDGKLYIEKAHRVAVRLAGREIPAGMVVMHTCDVPSCVNPAHLEVGTQLQNMRDMYARERNRQPSGETHHRAKLRAIQVQAIRALYQLGWSVESLADTFSVTAPTIAAIVSRRTWTHV